MYTALERPCDDIALFQIFLETWRYSLKSLIVFTDQTKLMWTEGEQSGFEK